MPKLSYTDNNASPGEKDPAKRAYKGKSLIDFPDDFCIVALETTGFSPQYDDIIEISALRIRGGQAVDAFSTFVKPRMVASFFNLIKQPKKVDAKITLQTGITNEMLAAAPTLDVVIPSVCNFIGADILVGSNIGTDINFIYDAALSVQGRYFLNDYIDILRIARKIYPERSLNRLCDVADAVGLSPRQYHRTLDDCRTVFECFCAMRNCAAQNVTINLVGRRSHKSTSRSSLNPGSEKTAPVQGDRKGKSLIDFPNNYCVVDLETTGLSPEYDEIIEISALRVRSGLVVDSFSTLVKPRRKITAKITSITGITNDMVASAPMLADVLPAACTFIGNDTLIGSNVGFDVSFLYNAVQSVQGGYFSNDYIDTVRIARKVFPELPHHRLCDVAAAVGVSPKRYHRALDDCQTTFECFSAMRDLVIQNEGIEAFTRKHHFYTKPDLRTITAENTVFDETHPLFGKHCVFTGALQKMTRTDAAQLVVNVGGICDNNITKKTNFLILGNNDYCKSITDGKSSKQKKAEEYKQNGLDIEVIPEDVFYDMLGE